MRVLQSPSAQVEDALLEAKENIEATLTLLQGKGASSEQSIGASNPTGQPTMANPTTNEDNR